MRTLLLALSLVIAATLARPSLAAQLVEESFTRDPGPLDFIRGESHEQWILQSLAGDALVGIAPDGRLVPRLADHWEARKDGTIHFRLRPDARYEDGSRVTAEDVLWTVRQIQGDAQASPTKRAILAEAQAGGSGSAVWIRSRRPAGRLLMELARIPVAQVNHPDSGSGPFTFRKERDAWVFTRRDHFLKPRIDGVRFRLLPDAAGVMTALQKGWLSIGAPATRRQADLPRTHRLVTQPMHAQLVVWSRRGPAHLLLLERWRKDAFPAHLLGRNARPSRGLWPESLGFEPLAIEGGTPRPQSPGPLRLLFGTGDESVEKLLLALKERARKDGFDLQLEPLEQGLLLERLQQGGFDLACSVVVFDPHPWSVLDYLEPTGAMNFTGWSHPQLDLCCAGLQQSGGPAWRELQALWARNPAALPLLDFQSVIWVDQRLQVEPSPQGLYLHTPGAAGWQWKL